MAKRTSSRVVPRPPPPPRGGVAAIVLAAGSSSRMGQPKALLPLLGKPLLVHSLDTLRASPVDEIVLVVGAEANRIRGAVTLEKIRVIVNSEYASGMSSSIRAGCRAVSPSAGAFLIVLADQPLVAVATVDALVSRYRVARPRILVPTYRGVRGNPVLLDRSLSQEIEAVRGDIGCRGVVAAHAAEVLEVPVDDPGILLDVDTPEDLEAMEKALGEGTPLERLIRSRPPGR